MSELAAIIIAFLLLSCVVKIKNPSLPNCSNLSSIFKDAISEEFSGVPSTSKPSLSVCSAKIISLPNNPLNPISSSSFIAEIVVEFPLRIT
ncbi:hypothetical protein ES705_48550 [subsurface metagenome]